ncbi:hypothetical protein [Longispora albida]|uniref:hypothetical protein n=1 Tax=Longispora albida TaxID=203523 RepID=UPI0003A23D6A|nr:hypothetical protein [Longispora albida]
MRGRRRALVAVLTLGLLFNGPPPAAAETPHVWEIDKLTDSAVITKGPKTTLDDYSGMEFTVSQTKGLTNQSIAITWTGGRPTPEDGFGTNFVQIMQCWGEDPAAADFRETCQFGSGLEAAGYKPGAYTAHRDIYPDPLETTGRKIVAFKSVLGQRTPDGRPGDPLPERPGGGGQIDSVDVLAPYFDKHKTNEISYALTTGARTGRAIFEVQTAVQAPHLGCGKVRTDGTPRHCWLVIVPRGEHDADGTAQDGSNGQVDGSPLSETFWKARIAVKLEFDPVGVFCPLGRAERRLVGTEMIADAITSWQPSLCMNNGPVFGYSQAGDFEALRQLRSHASTAPGLAFTAEPAVPAEDQAPVLHAPVAVSGVVIAFNVDARLTSPGPEQGTAVRELKLTPRLVAKMLTHSYKRDVPGGLQGEQEHVKNNFRSIRHDKEFSDLNRIVQGFYPNHAPDGLIVSIGNSAAAREVWRWILADKDAVDWLKGSADGTMVVNSFYSGLTAEGPPSSYPKADPSCYPKPKPVPDPADPPPYCMQDYRPYVNTMREGALQTLRGDARSKSVWDPSKTPPAYVGDPPQPAGQRFTMTITDTASAARYGLYPASLRNRAGEFVAPTPQAMDLGYAAMVNSSVPGVLVPDPQKAAPGAYPLTMVTYAAIDTSEPAAARQDYARLLRYAAGPGQITGKKRGELPAGFVPLRADARAAAVATAEKLEKWVDPVEPAEPDPPAAGPVPVTGGGGAVAGPPDRGVPVPTAKPAPSGPSAAPSTSGGPVPVARATPGSHLGFLRWVWAVTVLAGLLSASLGPALLRLTRRAPAR